MVDVPARLKATLEHLVTDGPEPGRPWCRAWTVEVDAAVVELAADVSATGRWSLAAVGGYGRRELCPASDLDLLVLHDDFDETELEQIVRAVVYPLWDAGLKVGYAVRSAKEAAKAIKGELDDATSILDARPLAGNGPLLHDVRSRAIASLHKRPEKFLTALTEADGKRHARAGDAAEMLEPDLKNGAGGLRDVQSLRWAAAGVVGSPGLDPLVSARYLGAADRSRLARAYDHLLAERVALHLEMGRAGEVLRLDLQDAVATRLGLRDGATDMDTKAHRLLTAHYRAARTVSHLHLRAWSLLVADASTGRRWARPAEKIVDGFEVAAGVLRVPDEQLVHDVALPSRLLVALADEGALLDRSTASALRALVRSRGDLEWGWNDTSREQFLSVLSALPPIITMLYRGRTHETQEFLSRWAHTSAGTGSCGINVRRRKRSRQPGLY